MGKSKNAKEKEIMQKLRYTHGMYKAVSNRCTEERTQYINVGNSAK